MGAKIRSTKDRIRKNVKAGILRLWIPQKGIQERADTKLPTRFLDAATKLNSLPIDRFKVVFSPIFQAFLNPTIRISSTKLRDG
jgi:hypothetical protein